MVEPLSVSTAKVIWFGFWKWDKGYQFVYVGLAQQYFTGCGKFSCCTYFCVFHVS